MTRVVITGMGAVSPNGNGFDEFVEHTLAGKIGIKPITKFDAAPTGITVAGQIDDFDPSEVVGKKDGSPDGSLFTICHSDGS
jgi:3-oxoacyl-(acyl-carrier-protein) synthase